MQGQTESALIEADGVFKIGDVDVDQDTHGCSFKGVETISRARCGMRPGRASARAKEIHWLGRKKNICVCRFGDVISAS
jgi:hypothetical protein